MPQKSHDENGAKGDGSGDQHAQGFVTCGHSGLAKTKGCGECGCCCRILILIFVTLFQIKTLMLPSHLEEQIVLWYQMAQLH